MGPTTLLVIHFRVQRLQSPVCYIFQIIMNVVFALIVATCIVGISSALECNQGAVIDGVGGIDNKEQCPSGICAAAFGVHNGVKAYRGVACPRNCQHQIVEVLSSIGRLEKTYTKLLACGVVTKMVAMILHSPKRASIIK